MPTNAQRRETAKRKLERQLERRAKRAKRQRILTVVGAMVALAAAAGVIVTFVLNNKDSSTTTASPSSTSEPAPAATPARGGEGQLPVFAAPADLGANCKYPAAGQAAKKVDPPKSGKVPTDPATISVSMSTNEGNIGLILNNAEAPCTVNSFASLAQKGFFDDTVCHRLTTANSLGVLQCGDPSGDGKGARDTSSPTSTRPTSTRRAIRRCRRKCSTRAERWPWPTPARTPTAASSFWSTKIPSSRRTTRCSGPSTPPVWPPWTRSPRRGRWRRRGRQAGHRGEDQVGPAGLERPAVSVPPFGAPPPGACHIPIFAVPLVSPYPPHPPQRTNAYAVASLICAFVFAPLGSCSGHLSLSQIKRSGEQGRGLAIAGLVIGYLITVGTVLILLMGAVLLSWAAKVARENPQLGASGQPGRPSTTLNGSLPPFAPPAGLGSACAYPATDGGGQTGHTAARRKVARSPPRRRPCGPTRARSD